MGCCVVEDMKIIKVGKFSKEIDESTKIAFVTCHAIDLLIVLYLTFLFLYQIYLHGPCGSIWHTYSTLYDYQNAYFSGYNIETYLEISNLKQLMKTHNINFTQKSINFSDLHKDNNDIENGQC